MIAYITGAKDKFTRKLVLLCKDGENYIHTESPLAVIGWLRTGYESRLGNTALTYSIRGSGPVGTWTEYDQAFYLAETEVALSRMGITDIPFIEEDVVPERLQ